MQTLFEKYFNATDEQKAAEGKKTVRRDIKLKFQAVLADISKKIVELEKEEIFVNQKCWDLNINRLIEIAEETEFLERDKKRLQDLYVDWFGTSLKDIDEQ